MKSLPFSGDSLTLEVSSLADLVRGFTVELAAGARRGAHAGSGVIWHGDGLVVTNAHVARRDEYLVTLAGGDRIEAPVIARDRERDLAALALPLQGLPSAPTGNARALRTGSLVLALGHPWGVSNALSLGVVHHVVPGRDGSPRWIAADVQLAPGNSGGPLVDATGRVVGLNAMIVGGLGTAIPVNVVTAFLREHVGRSVWAPAMWAA
jgi:serine protease Do